ncbi:hypothetical protein JTB14_010226 [Gonioctena quinquepunctata]|nr:hypothetical protein JTB14_010226 [Gonioctena quinquepunctata]
MILSILSLSQKPNIFLFIQSAAGNDIKIALGVDQGKWYDLKRNPVQQAGPSRSDNNMDPQSPVSLLPKFPSLVSPKYFNKGSQFVDSDHISEVFDAKKDNHYFVKCKSHLSKKKVKYDVEIILNNTSGAVIKRLCNCKQSALGKCVHVTALILFIEKYIEENGNAPIVTKSKPREWGLGSRIQDLFPLQSIL